MSSQTVTHIVVRGTAMWQQLHVGGYLVASCPSLNIVVWGESEAELEVKQYQAVGLVVLYLHSRSILESFLEARGFAVTVTEGSVVRQEAAGVKRWPVPSGPHLHLPLRHVCA